MSTIRSASRHSSGGRPRKSPLRVATMSPDAAALLDRYGADLQDQQAFEAKKRRGDLY